MTCDTDGTSGNAKYKSLNPKGSLPKMDRRTTTNQTSAKATMRFDETGSSSLGDMAPSRKRSQLTLVIGSSLQ